MDKSAASAYVHAKAAGMLAKAFVGERAALLFDAKTPSDLWTIVFKTEIPLIPGKLLVRRIEQQAEEKFVADFAGLLDCYDKPDPLAAALLRSFEFSNIKDLTYAVREGLSQIPRFVDIGKYGRIRYDKWPDIAAMTAGTDLSWYNEVPPLAKQGKMDFLLDCQYVRELWNAVLHLSAFDRVSVADYIREELILQYCVWGLRLRVYYGMNPEEAAEYLAFDRHSCVELKEILKPALQILAWPLDDYNIWCRWTYSHLLNPNDGSIWSVDPRWIQQTAAVMMYKKAHFLFRTQPSSAAVLVSWFKIKQYELNCIKAAAEGIQLDADKTRLKHFVETGV
ncbi:MAG: V-type ATPase subunit [Bacteroides sp.]|nr:V-type ATPase subunit [Prevotella sp.]MCM1406980.1 V-type ATPase subunit [Treponema brennaborense]MCM1470131.1 V-type ATPase subunit [Bacteroides sp.]